MISVWSDNSDRWNFLVGFNWAVSQRWNVHFEADAGGSRQGVTASATWRF
jgi:D-serine deaminase-like pyridoxal phosphate-dependent protein